MARRFEESLAEIRKTVEMAPNFVPGLTDMGRVLTHLDRTDEAIAMFERAASLSSIHPYTNAGLGYAFARAGRRDEAMRVAQQLEKRLVKTGQGSAHGIASIYIGLGELDQALHWLERALEMRDRALVWLHVHPRLDPLRSNPRFEALVRRALPQG
jgi:tetratricopeptide (TPR) repeat protein